MSEKVEKFNFNNLNSGQGAHPAGDFKPGINNALRVKEKVSNANKVESNSNKKQEEAEEKYKYMEEDLASAKTKGYEDGYAKGYADAKSASEELNKSIDENLKIIDEKVTQIIQMNQNADLKKSKDVAEIIAKIAAKIAGSALQSNPLDEIEKVVQKSFELFFDEPRLAIYINSELVPEISKKVDVLSQKENFRGEVEIYGRENIEKGSCSVEWQGGGLKSDKADILSEIEKMCSQLG